MDMKEFGKQLDLYLFMQKMSSQSFAKKTGIGTSTIARITKQQIDALQQPTKDKFAKYFKIPFEEIERNPAIINEEIASSFFKGIDFFKRKARVIKLLTYKQFIEKADITETIPVTNDIDINCFALIVENSDFMTISDGDIIIINPDIIDIELLNSKTVLLQTITKPHQLLIRKVIVIEDDIFLKGKKTEVYSSDEYELIGWITEIRYRR